MWKKPISRLFPYKWLLLAWVFYACSKENEDTVSSFLSAPSYFNFDTGYYREYQVESKKFSTTGNGIPDSSQTYLRYEHQGVTFLQDGTKAILIDRFKKSTTSDPWEYDSTFLLWNEASGVLESKSNQINFLLPSLFKQGTTWNFNQLNNLDAVNSEVLDTDRAVMGFKNLVYAQIEKRPVNFVSSKNHYKIYAQGIGELIYYRESLTYFQGNQFGLFIPQSGEIYKEELIAQGNIR